MQRTVVGHRPDASKSRKGRDHLAVKPPRQAGVVVYVEKAAHGRAYYAVPARRASLWSAALRHDLGTSGRVTLAHAPKVGYAAAFRPARH
ncbi:MAG: hypothetical protein Q7J57_15210 [Gemmobacter sp.]|nr:hypothetical protein [Gemmobacter sp.]